jgi:molybdopterin molybdotransferase
MALLPVPEAIARILDGVKPLAAEAAELSRSQDRVLAAPVKAVRHQPPFDASAMDGYALRHADLAAGTTTFVLAGTSAAGHGWKGTVKPGQAIRILTGAPVPRGADTIVIQENTRREGNALTVLEVPAQGRNIREAGADFRKGEILLPAGIRLRARDIGLAAAGNAATLKVRRRPRLVLFTTGDELVLPGARPRADQIVSSNSHAIEAMARRLGADVVNLGIVADTLKATGAAIRKGFGADILVTTGGASVGDHDYVQEALKGAGVSINFWKIAMRPGKPFMFGRKGRTRVLGLPGNPVSALVCARLFLNPLINALLGLPTSEVTATARLEGSLPANDERQDYIRATLDTAPDGTRIARPFSRQDSSMQRTFRESGCLIIRPAHAPAIASGAEIPVLVLDF